MSRPMASRPSSGKLRNGAPSSARLKPRNQNSDEYGDSPDAYSQLSREDVIMTLLQFKKQVSILESERSILKADNRRWEMEYLKQQQRFEKLLDPKFSKNSVAVAEMRREVEKTGLVRQLKQQVNVLRLQIAEKDNQFDELKNNIKASYLAEVVAEKEEYYSEVQRLRQLLKEKFASSTISANRGGERVNIPDRTTTPGRSRSRPSSANSTSNRQRSSSPYIRMPFQQEDDDEERGHSGPFSSNQPRQPKSIPVGMSNIQRPSSASKRLSGNAVNDARILENSNSRPRSAGARVNSNKGNAKKTNIAAAIDTSNTNFDRNARNDRGDRGHGHKTDKHGRYNDDEYDYNEGHRDPSNPRDAYGDYVDMVHQSSGQGHTQEHREHSQEHLNNEESLVQEQEQEQHGHHHQNHHDSHNDHNHHNSHSHHNRNENHNENHDRYKDEKLYPDQDQYQDTTDVLNGGLDTMDTMDTGGNSNNNSGIGDGGFNDNLDQDDGVDGLLSGPGVYADSKSKSKQQPAIVPIKLTDATCVPRFNMNDKIEGLYGNGTKWYSGKVYKLYPPSSDTEVSGNGNGNDEMYYY